MHVKVDGHNMGECNPDGSNYDCIYFECPGLHRTFKATKDEVEIEEVQNDFDQAAEDSDSSYENESAEEDEDDEFIDDFND